MLRSAICAGLLLWTPAALAQSKPQSSSYHPPRAPDGHPDLQGVWGTSFVTMLERPGFLTTLVIPDADADAIAAKINEGVPDLIDPDFFIQNISSLARVGDEYRSSLVVEPADGRIPYAQKGLDLVARYDALWELYDNPEERENFERCTLGIGAPPIRQIPAHIPSQIVQTPSAIIIATEDVGMPRIIHMDAPPPPDEMRTVAGWSRGRWEGDTLVVETTHLSDRDPYRGGFGRPILVQSGSRVIERFTLIGDNALHYQYTVEDASLYSAPWRAEYVFDRSDHHLLEYACHEANYSLANMLTYGRVREPPPPR